MLDFQSITTTVQRYSVDKEVVSRPAPDDPDQGGHRVPDGVLSYAGAPWRKTNAYNCRAFYGRND